MNKKVLSFIVLLGLFSVTGFVCAVGLKSYGVEDWGNLLSGLVKAVSEIIGGVAVIMFMVAGILFATSGGQPGQITKAKTALMYAIAGIVISLIAGAIVKFIRTAMGA